MKSLPTLALALPWLVLALVRGKGRAPTARQRWLLIGGGVAGQIGGNISMQLAFDSIGLAMTIPITTGSLIVAGAWLAKWLLGESTSRQNMIANAVLVFAVMVLSLGAAEAFRAVRETSQERGAWMAWLGIAAACLPGVAYSLQNIVLRKVLNEGCHISGALLTISTTGALIAAIWLCLAGDLPELAFTTSAATYRMMIAAGVFNAAAFVALSIALHLTPIWFVYALSSSQVALAAVLGVWLFDEPLSASLVGGVALTIAGLLLIRARG